MQRLLHTSVRFIVQFRCSSILGFPRQHKLQGKRGNQLTIRSSQQIRPNSGSPLGKKMLRTHPLSTVEPWTDRIIKYQPYEVSNIKGMTCYDMQVNRLQISTFMLTGVLGLTNLRLYITDLPVSL